MGLGRFELPTSRLSGVRSNQLSYRPKLVHRSAHWSVSTELGGADRDRTDDLLNANQALSQAELQPLIPGNSSRRKFNRGQLDVRQGPALAATLRILSREKELLKRYGVERLSATLNDRLGKSDLVANSTHGLS